MPNLIYTPALKKLVDGTFDLDGHTFKAALLDASHTPDADHEFWSDVSGDEVSGSGYTAGGQPLSNVTLGPTGATLKFDADDLLWGQADYTFRYVVIYDNNLAGKDLLLLLDYESEADPDNKAFFVRFHADGIMTMAQA